MRPRAVLAIGLVLAMLSAPARPGEIAGRARVIDGDSLVLAGEALRLEGIDAPERDQLCFDREGTRYRCGLRAAAALRALVADHELRCRTHGRDRYGRLLATCMAGGRSLNAAMVAQGWALAYRRYSLAYVGEEEAARRARAGLWAGRFEAPWRWRRAARQAGEAGRRIAATAGCRIKGNISARGRIYHLPGSRDYERVRIHPARGERWFCSEAEARAAGWRPPGG